MIQLTAVSAARQLKYLFKSSVLVTRMATYDRRPPRGLREEETDYPGLDGEPVPVTVIHPARRSLDATMVVYHGATPEGERHPGILMLGRVLASLGYLVVLPQLPPLKRLEISKESVAWIAGFHSWLRDYPGVQPNNIVAVAMSFAGTLLLKALLHPEVQSAPPKSVLTYGAFCNLLDTYDFLLTGMVQSPEGERYIEPHEWGMVVVFHNYLKRIEPGFDTSDLERVIKLRAHGLDAEFEAALETMNARDRGIVDAILGERPSETLQELLGMIRRAAGSDIADLSPEYWASEINSRIFVMHGSDDSMVPYTEALALSRVVQNAHLFITNMAKHEHMKADGGGLSRLVELIRMLFFFREFIRSSEA